MANEMTINDTKVRFARNVPQNDETIKMCKDFIKNRLSTPIVAFLPHPTSKPSIRFMHADERDRAANVPHIKLKIRNRDVDVCCFFGMKPEQLTENDKLFIEELLYEDVFVDIWDDGTPYIDD